MMGRWAWHIEIDRRFEAFLRANYADEIAMMTDIAPDYISITKQTVEGISHDAASLLNSKQPPPWGLFQCLLVQQGYQEIATANQVAMPIARPIAAWVVLAQQVAMPVFQDPPSALSVDLTNDVTVPVL
jgi:hypothetical protein